MSSWLGDDHLVPPKETHQLCTTGSLFFFFFGVLSQYTLPWGWPSSGSSDPGTCRPGGTMRPFNSYTVSFCFSHSQWLLLSTASSLMVLCWAFPLIPTSFGSLMIKGTTKNPAALLHWTHINLEVTPLENGSQGSVRVISSLVLEHLYSFTKLDTGRKRSPLPNRPMLVRHLGRLSHFTNRSSRLAWAKVTSLM